MMLRIMNIAAKIVAYEIFDPRALQLICVRGALICFYACFLLFVAINQLPAPL